ncbi:RNA polymerase sigma factor [candidate division KSB1 bacterium]
MERGRITKGLEPSDEELMVRIATGDVRALEILVSRHREKAYRLALGITGDRGTAMDASQEAFIRFYRSAGRFRSEKKFFSWFYRILRNRALTEVNKRKRRSEETVGLDFPFQPDQAESPEATDLKRTVWDAIGRLPEDSREIIVLRHFNGLSYAEIAEALSLPAGTVMSRLHTARRRLRDELEGEFP